MINPGTIRKSKRRFLGVMMITLASAYAYSVVSFSPAVRAHKVSASYFADLGQHYMAPTAGGNNLSFNTILPSLIYTTGDEGLLHCVIETQGFLLSAFERNVFYVNTTINAP